LREKAARGSWEAFAESVALLSFAEQLIFVHLNPGLVPPDFVTIEERAEEEVAKLRAVWFNAPAEGRCPVVTSQQILAAIEGLSDASARLVDGRLAA